MPLDAGIRLGPYEIIASIGRGGMGEVYRARDTELERDVAIKVLPDDVMSDPSQVGALHFERRSRNERRYSQSETGRRHGRAEELNRRAPVN